MSDLWDDASRDFEEEQAIRRLHSAKARVAGTWSFLANAQDTSEYAQRKEMAVEALADAVWAVTADADEAEETWKRLHASLDEDFSVIVEARKLAHKTAASHDPVAYTYDADVHCPGCAEERFGRDAHGFIAGQGAQDSEGNEPGILAPWDETDAHGEHCGTCGGQIVSPYDHNPDDCGYAGCTGKVDEHGRVHYHNPRNKKDQAPSGEGDALPFEGARRTAINDAEVSQYSSEVANNRRDEALRGHPQNCTSCGTHFDGNASHINFTPGPQGAEWNHCPNCFASAQHGQVQDCGPECQADHDPYLGEDYSSDDQDPHYGDVHHHGAKTAGEKNVWGTDRDNVDADEFCPDCEHENSDAGDGSGLHYDNCPHHPKNRKRATLNVLAVVRILAGDEAGKYIIVDEDSGYKVGGPFESRSEAEQAIASGKYKGKNVKIERAGEEEAKEEDAHKGGRGSHDGSGGSKPFDNKGNTRKGSGGRHPFA
jgi:hypothetical protein